MCFQKINDGIYCNCASLQKEIQAWGSSSLDEIVTHFDYNKWLLGDNNKQHYLVSKFSKGDNVFAGVADLPLVELVLERLHDGRSVADRVNQNNTEASEKTKNILFKFPFNFFPNKFKTDLSAIVHLGRTTECVNVLG